MTIKNHSSINWRAQGAARTAQNIQNLLALSTYEVAFSRTMGINGELLDRSAAAIPLLKAEVYRNINTYEPGVNVRDVQINIDADGHAEITVEVDL